MTSADEFVTFAETLCGIKLHPYQRDFARKVFEMTKNKTPPKPKRPKGKPGDLVYGGGMVFKIGPLGGKIPQPQITPTTKFGRKN